MPEVVEKDAPPIIANIKNKIERLEKSIFNPNPIVDKLLKTANKILFKP